MEEKLRKKLKSESRIILFGLVILLGLALFIAMFSLVVCLGLDKATEAEKQNNPKIILAAALIFLCGSVVFLKILIPVGKDYQLLKKREYRIEVARLGRISTYKKILPPRGKTRGGFAFVAIKTLTYKIFCAIIVCNQTVRKHKHEHSRNYTKRY